ncbi:MAG: universal stress protein [Planctomycetota bacterium]
MARAPVRKILVPVDLSRRDVETVDYAIALALQLGAELWLFSVIDSPTKLYLIQSQPAEHKKDEGFNARVVEDAKVLLRRLVDRATQKGVQAFGHAVVSERPDREIPREAQERGVDLILFGDREHGLLSRLFFGDTTEEVLEKAPCPVLVVKHRDRR